MERSDGGPGSGPIDSSRGRVLVVDDEEALRRAYGRILGAAGFAAELASSGRVALDALEHGEFDVVVSDIAMADMDGLALLRATRERDLDLPVVLITGNPTLDTATRAVEFGALRYLVKPVESETLIETVERAAKLGRIARLKREAAVLLGAGDKLVGDRAGLEATLSRGLDTMWMAYQPLVDPVKHRIAAFEALVRTEEPRLPHPGALFSVAERLGRVHDVGRAVRRSILRTLSERDFSGDIFVNLHPGDLLDESLFSSDSPLAPYANRLVLEITERSSLDNGVDVSACVRRLRKLGFRIAIDDLGAGYAGLSYFTLLSPDVVKLDIALVRNVHREAIKRKLVASLSRLCKDLGMLVVGEGVESPEERDTLLELGCDLLQGFLFARPGPPFPQVSW